MLGLIRNLLRGKKWECSKQCKPLNEFEVVAIVTFRAAFELSVEEVRQALAKCDMGCPNGHYTKLEGTEVLTLGAIGNCRYARHGG